MAAATAAALAVLVKTRCGGTSSSILRQLTNESGTGPTIDDDVLEACCDDAIGEFAIATGIFPDLDYRNHVLTLVAGTLYFLENYKGRDSAYAQSRAKDFYSKLKREESKKYVLAQSSSELSASTQRSGTRPDMDRAHSVFMMNQQRTQPNETWEE
jgi:hypothetical protein